MSRAKRLAAIRAAGYHADASAFYRAFKGSQIHPDYASDEWAHGHSLRAAGRPCDCATCKQVTRV